MKIRREKLTWQELDDEIVVLDLAGSVYLQVNGTGADLWKALLDEADRAQLVTTLTSAYDVDERTAEHDVDVFLEQLRAAELLIEEREG